MTDYDYNPQSNIKRLQERLSNISDQFKNETRAYKPKHANIRKEMPGRDFVEIEQQSSYQPKSELVEDKNTEEEDHQTQQADAQQLQNEENAETLFEKLKKETFDQTEKEGEDKDDIKTEEEDKTKRKKKWKWPW